MTKRAYVNVTDQDGELVGRFPVQRDDVDIRNPAVSDLLRIGREVVDQLPRGYFDEKE